MKTNIECPLKSCVYNEAGYCHKYGYSGGVLDMSRSYIVLKISPIETGQALYCDTYSTEKEE